MNAWETVRKFWLKKYSHAITDNHVAGLDFDYKAHNEDIIVPAMKEHAIEFAKWCGENYVHSTTDNTDSWHDKFYKYYSTDQLYSEFKNQK